MSLDSAMKFITVAAQDKTLREQVKHAGHDADAMITVASKAGFSFSADDFTKALAAIEEARLRGEAPLGDDDLDMIAGGTGWGQN